MRSRHRILMWLLCTGAFFCFLLAPAFNVAQEQKSPSVENGYKLFEDMKCLDCHYKDHDGEGEGKDLSKEGKKRDQQWLTDYLKDIKASHPKLERALQEGEVKDLTNYLIAPRTCSERCH